MSFSQDVVAIRPRANGTYLSEHEGEDAGKYLKRNGGG
jgi:hypothetical protein